MLCTKRCEQCPGPSHPTEGPVLCDNPTEDCPKFCPSDKPHQFTLTVGPYKTPYKLMCPGCGYTSPVDPLAHKSLVQCVLCGYAFIIKPTK